MTQTKNTKKVVKHAQNVGTLERWMRIIGGAVAAFIGLRLFLPLPTSLLLSITGIALVVLGLDFVMTGITGYCPLYQRLGWSTNGHRL